MHTYSQDSVDPKKPSFKPDWTAQYSVNFAAHHNIHLLKGNQPFPSSIFTPLEGEQDLVVGLRVRICFCVEMPGCGGSTSKSKVPENYDTSSIHTSATVYSPFILHCFL